MKSAGSQTARFIFVTPGNDVLSNAMLSSGGNFDLAQNASIYLH